MKIYYNWLTKKKWHGRLKFAILVPENNWFKTDNSANLNYKNDSLDKWQTYSQLRKRNYPLTLTFNEAKTTTMQIKHYLKTRIKEIA